MKTIYEIIGMIVFWGAVLSGAAYGSLFIYFRYVKYILESDQVRYWQGKTVDTETLRLYYDYWSKNDHLKKWLLKFRLRNIKRARK